MLRPLVPALATSRTAHFSQDWDIETVPLSPDDFSYALGAQGSTRRKLAKASGAVLEYVGMLACIAGTKAQRSRCRDYLRWLLKQRLGPVSVDYLDRDDVLAVPVPPQSVGFITGARGETLRTVERNSGTFCFTSSARPEDMVDGVRHDETLLIFCHDKRARDRARDEIEDRIHEHARLQRGGAPRHVGGGDRDTGDRRDRDRGRHDDRYDDRYDDRRDRGRDYDRRRHDDDDRRR